MYFNKLKNNNIKTVNCSNQTLCYHIILFFNYDYIHTLRYFGHLGFTVFEEYIVVLKL